MTSLARQFSCHDAYDPTALNADLGRQLILDAVSPISGIEHIPLRDALGRVLAQPVISPIDVPAHDNSAMDGYGLRGDDISADGDTVLDIIGSAFAGQGFDGSVGPGQAVRIMTGAPLPAGVDTVVMQEVTRAADGKVTIPAGQRRGQNVRRAGEDLRAHLPALPAARLIRPAELGLVASLGIVEVAVRRRLRVAFFSTGNEIATIGTLAAPGQIYDASTFVVKIATFAKPQTVSCNMSAPRHDRK